MDTLGPQFECVEHGIVDEFVARESYLGLLSLGKRSKKEVMSRGRKIIIDDLSPNMDGYGIKLENVYLSTQAGGNMKRLAWYLLANCPTYFRYTLFRVVRGFDEMCEKAAAKWEKGSKIERHKNHPVETTMPQMTFIFSREKGGTLRLEDFLSEFDGPLAECSEFYKKCYVLWNSFKYCLEEVIKEREKELGNKIKVYEKPLACIDEVLKYYSKKRKDAQWLRW